MEALWRHCFPFIGYVLIDREGQTTSGFVQKTSLPPKHRPRIWRRCTCGISPKRSTAYCPLRNLCRWIVSSTEVDRPQAVAPPLHPADLGSHSGSGTAGVCDIQRVPAARFSSGAAACPLGGSTREFVRARLQSTPKRKGRR